MASTPKLLSVLFLFALFSIQIHAREFFSKIPRENTNEKESTIWVPNKEEQQEPSFSPETQNGYGLYGHEAKTNTKTKETYEPYVTPVKFHPDEPYNMIPASKNSNNNNKDSYFYSKSAEESTEKENLGEARFTEKGWSTKENQNNNYYNGNNEEAMFTEKGWSTKENNNNNNNYYSNGNNEYNKNAYGDSMFTEKGWSTNNNNNNNHYNGEKQGMSDTRFLEKGKYYYDVDSENTYDPNQFKNSRGFASRNGFNENRYNNKRRYNQNQEEFEENEEEFEP